MIKFYANEVEDQVSTSPSMRTSERGGGGVQAQGIRASGRYEGRLMRATRSGLVVMLAALTTPLWGGGPVPEFRTADWTLVTTLADVPEAVLEALAARFGSDDGIARRGERFEATDEVSGAPSKRFVLGGQDGALWFIALEQGGYVHQLVFTLVRVDGAAAHVTLVARGIAGQHDDSSGGWRVTVDELRAALADGSLRVESRSGELD